MADNLKIVEIGDKPFIKSAYPRETVYFSTMFNAERSDPEAGTYSISLATLPALHRALHDSTTSLVVCHPTFYSPWHWRFLVRALFDRRTLQGHVPLIRAYGPQFLRSRITAPIAVLDQDDLPVINRNNFFLLDRCVTYFKRELPVDRWQLLLKTGHPNLPTHRFRQISRHVEKLKKLRPISMGLPMRKSVPLAQPVSAKTADIFFAGRVDASSWVRTRGFPELLALREQGIVVDVPDAPLPPEEFYRRCAAARLVWSPEGYGWECFRHYEALACGSVPICNHATVERYRPLEDGVHAIYYSPEPGGLTAAVTAALADKTRLQRIAHDGQAHMRAYHTPHALAAYVVDETFATVAGSGADASLIQAETRRRAAISSG